MMVFLCRYAATVDRAYKLQSDLNALLQEKEMHVEDVNAKKRALESYEIKCANMKPTDDTMLHMFMLMEKCRSRLTQQVLLFDALEAKLSTFQKAVSNDKTFITTNYNTFINECKNYKENELPFNKQDITTTLSKLM